MHVMGTGVGPHGAWSMPPMHHPCATHAPPMCHPCTTLCHPCTIHVPPMHHPCATHVPPMCHPCATHAPPMCHPCTNHAPLMYHPCTTHVAPMCHPCATHAPSHLYHPPPTTCVMLHGLGMVFPSNTFPKWWMMMALRNSGEKPQSHLRSRTHTHLTQGCPASRAGQEGPMWTSMRPTQP